MHAVLYSGPLPAVHRQLDVLLRIMKYFLLCQVLRLPMAGI